MTYNHTPPSDKTPAPLSPEDRQIQSQLRSMDTNRDGRISRQEIVSHTRDAVTGLALSRDETTGKPAIDCDKATYIIPALENAAPGTTRRLSEGTQKEHNAAVKTVAEYIANVRNENMQSDAVKKHHPSGGVETVRAQDFMAIARSTGQIMRHCGLTETDAPTPMPEAPDTLYSERPSPRNGREV